MPKGIKGFQKGHKHSEATKIKIGQSNSKHVKCMSGCHGCQVVSVNS